MSDSELPEERDDQTFSMFGEDEAPKSAEYQVLARKYRPRRFEDLIGQEAMVRTLSNAFETGRVAHAFMLTGVRGVGKTTTARLLARALNYQSDDHDGPSIRLDPKGEHCDAIMASRHPDVLELDAASRTGVADMRDLLDGARYAPVSARHKVYIIDEVHMLSTAAFNALLKTLEEPPPHVKFIFATTEIRKVPITVLSRCQRFDLKRLDAVNLSEHLGRVATHEGAKVSEEGLALIARAAEGSVRDGLSILDQAIVQTMDGEEVTGAAVRDMLGLGDRARLLDAFEKAISGSAAEALAEVKDQIHAGADPAVILKDLMDVCADVSVAQATGGEFQSAGPAEWTQRTLAMAQKLTAAQAARYWQILLSGFNDLQTAPDTATALNMIILRLAAAANLPSPEEAARMIAESGGAPGKPEQHGMAPSPAGGLESFAQIVAYLGEHREVNLQVELERYIRPGPVRYGYFSCELEDNAPNDLLARLKAFLERDTGDDWVVEQIRTNAETMRQTEIRTREELFASAAAHPAVADALKSIPGITIVDVTEPAASDGNVIDLNSRRSA
ncbi:MULTISPECIES: DNA polymerase III subunit gamma/tau [unclassified Hyphomonas]|jgi:DNA polymerase-3 subunit gamma/tau|uniref:DNA-directed DNA polymerase n=4 Tax=root TaxID=1 RepID=A0A160TYL1_9ZZZZ|nr:MULTISPECIES: DNA polymerase III subunit gamma/tau [unclassified Hyphomonas]MAL47571.1 DNA polymerase III subunit gamma/tau [Hyphomonas sp.]MAX84945.1 DNA polymerase III subunit gamma/tau [Hyphomonas sp.]HBJ40929.1 DNA polymerase III subunit gamma/tau [Hyphomonas sp.]|tara:strand:+ start:1347 stop:3026 length:1680 start_codon:yes stop_codon:yes gene_type:complete